MLGERMKTYPAGDLTKENILKAGRKVFFKDGYKKAKMKEISDLAGIKQSVFYYHYKNKAELAQVLYGQFGTAHSTAIVERVIEKGYTNSIVTAHLVSGALLIMNSIDQPQVGRFWGEMYADNLTTTIKFQRYFHGAMYKKRFKHYDPEWFDLYLIENAAINAAYLLACLEKKINISSVELAKHKTRYTLRALEYSSSEKEALTKKIIDIAKDIPIRCEEDFKIFMEDEKIY